jgi:hypothetical protein
MLWGRLERTFVSTRDCCLIRQHSVPIRMGFTEATGLEPAISGETGRNGAGRMGTPRKQIQRSCGSARPGYALQLPPIPGAACQTLTKTSQRVRRSGMTVLPSRETSTDAAPSLSGAHCPGRGNEGTSRPRLVAPPWRGHSHAFASRSRRTAARVEAVVNFVAHRGKWPPGWLLGSDAPQPQADAALYSVRQQLVAQALER